MQREAGKLPDAGRVPMAAVGVEDNAQERERKLGGMHGASSLG